jgi:hypothetical protein
LLTFSLDWQRKSKLSQGACAAGANPLSKQDLQAFVTFLLIRKEK